MHKLWSRRTILESGRLMIVPENKIAVIPCIEDSHLKPFNMEDLSTFLVPLNTTRKRDWFRSDFYKCLPLAIGNMQGFVFISPFEFDVMWNGGPEVNDVFFRFYEDEKYFQDKLHVSVGAHFGNGVMTISLPVILKTPPQVNLMTISPPNFPLPGLSPLTGVIETDNLRYTFTLNIKIDIPNAWIKIKAGSPLVGIIPIPRYFCDQFELIDGSVVLNEEDVEEERIVAKEHDRVRNFLSNSDLKDKYDRTYFLGKDIRGNKFKDHQLPKENGNHV